MGTHNKVCDITLWTCFSCWAAIPSLVRNMSEHGAPLFPLYRHIWNNLWLCDWQRRRLLKTKKTNDVTKTAKLRNQSENMLEGHLIGLLSGENQACCNTNLCLSHSRWTIQCCAVLTLCCTYSERATLESLSYFCQFWGWVEFALCRCTTSLCVNTLTLRILPHSHCVCSAISYTLKSGIDKLRFILLLCHLLWSDSQSAPDHW